MPFYLPQQPRVITTPVTQVTYNSCEFLGLKVSTVTKGLCQILTHSLTDGNKSFLLTINTRGFRNLIRQERLHFISPDRCTLLYNWYLMIMPCLCRSIWTGGPASSILDEVPAETPHQYSYVMITRSSQRYCCTVQCKGMKTCRKWCIGLKWHTNWLGKTYISSLQTPNNYFLKLWQHTKMYFEGKKLSDLYVWNLHWLDGENAPFLVFIFMFFECVVLNKDSNQKLGTNLENN